MTDSTRPAEEAPRTVPWLIRSIIPPLLLIALGLVMFYTSLSFRGTAARFPGAVSLLLIGFSLIDLYCRTNLPGAVAMHDFWGADFTKREMSTDPALREELVQIGWVIGCLVLVAIIGILPAMAIYCTAYIRFSGGLSWKASGMVGLAFMAFSILVFEWGLDFELYRGLLVSEGGVSAW
jgi:hypothetical protein